MSLRFLKATPSLIQQDIFYREPVELIQQALSAKQKAYDESEANLDQTKKELISKITGPSFRQEDVNTIRDKYLKKVEDLTKNLQETGETSKTRNSLRNLSNEFLEDSVSGDLAKLRSLSSASQSNIKSLQDLEGKDGFLTQKLLYNEWLSNVSKGNLDEASKFSMETALAKPEILETKNWQAFIKNIPKDYWASSGINYYDSDGKPTTNLEEMDVQQTFSKSGNSKSFSKIFQAVSGELLNNPELAAYWNQRERLGLESGNISEGIADEEGNITTESIGKANNALGRQFRKIFPYVENNLTSSSQSKKSVLPGDREGLFDKKGNVLTMSRKQFRNVNSQDFKNLGDRYKELALKQAQEKLSEDERIELQSIQNEIGKATPLKEEASSVLSNLGLEETPDLNAEVQSIILRDDFEPKDIQKLAEVLAKQNPTEAKWWQDSSEVQEEDFSNASARISTEIKKVLNKIKSKGDKIEDYLKDNIQEVRGISLDSNKDPISEFFNDSVLDSFMLDNSVSVFDGRSADADFLSNKANILQKTEWKFKMENIDDAKNNPMKSVVSTLEEFRKTDSAAKNMSVFEYMKYKGYGEFSIRPSTAKSGESVVTMELTNSGKSALGIETNRNVIDMHINMPFNKPIYDRIKTKYADNPNIIFNAMGMGYPKFQATNNALRKLEMSIKKAKEINGGEIPGNISIPMDINLGKGKKVSVEYGTNPTNPSQIGYFIINETKENNEVSFFKTEAEFKKALSLHLIN